DVRPAGGRVGQVELTVAEGRIAANQVARGRRLQGDAVAAVEPGGIAFDRVAGRVLEVDAVEPVLQRRVELHDVAATTQDADAVEGVLVRGVVLHGHARRRVHENAFVAGGHIVGLDSDVRRVEHEDAHAFGRGAEELVSGDGVVPHAAGRPVADLDAV